MRSILDELRTWDWVAFACLFGPAIAALAWEAFKALCLAS